MKKLIYSLILLVFGVITSCVDSLDIPPKSIMGGDNVYTENGIKSYIAGMYNRLPMDDFNVTEPNGKGSNVGVEGYFGWNNISWGMMSTGETVNGNNYRDQPMFYIESGYWSSGYQLIRAANDLIKDMPEYIGILSEAEELIAEAHFIRAYVYFQLVKRYGGVPLIKEPQYVENGNESSLWKARSSHEESYDFILEDLQYAIDNMSENKVNGRANKYVAAAFKSRVAVFAGSIAKYGGTFTHISDNVRLCGIPTEKANSYYEQAWEAAKFVEENGNYELYTDATKLSFANVFVNANTSKESIFIRQYMPNIYPHSFDHIYSPNRMTTSYGGRFNVTLDWVELFDELPLDPATGWLKTVDNSNNYIVYNNQHQLFENVKDTRFRGSLILPGDVFKGIQMDLRRGVIREAYDPNDTNGKAIQKFVEDDGYETLLYPATGYFGLVDNASAMVVITEEPHRQQNALYTLPSGVQINISGLDGPSNTSGNSATYTGFYGRKWLNPNVTVAETNMHESFQSWIDIRYAEVILNRAEAALELYHGGAENSTTMLADAVIQINKIRERAEVTPLTSSDLASTAPAHERGAGIGGFVKAPNRGIQLLRVERYKELAFEHKLYWDLRRWFSFHEQINDYRRRMLNPFLFANGASVNEQHSNPEGKFIYDTRICEFVERPWTFETRHYYERIPDAQLKINPLLIQNNQY